MPMIRFSRNTSRLIEPVVAPSSDSTPNSLLRAFRKLPIENNTNRMENTKMIYSATSIPMLVIRPISL
ncbi:hypothetical protein D3C76_1850610 [compost metagenome]